MNIGLVGMSLCLKSVISSWFLKILKNKLPWENVSVDIRVWYTVICGSLYFGEPEF